MTDDYDQRYPLIRFEDKGVITDSRPEEAPVARLGFVTVLNTGSRLVVALIDQEGHICHRVDSPMLRIGSKITLTLPKDHEH